MSQVIPGISCIWDNFASKSTDLGLTHKGLISFVKSGGGSRGSRSQLIQPQIFVFLPNDSLRRCRDHSTSTLSAPVKNDPKVNCEGRATFEGGNTLKMYVGNGMSLIYIPLSGKPMAIAQVGETEHRFGLGYPLS